MRIISGKHKGKNIIAPASLPVRPTTDFAKTGLFNILNNKIDFENITLLDLFSGTGNISYEFYSRGCKDITCVDADAKCVRFIKDTFLKLGYENENVLKGDVFTFLNYYREKFDVIFADPPYELNNIDKIPQLIFENKLLNPNGLLIIEHASEKKFDWKIPFSENRKYGHVGFTFFEAS